MREAVQVTTVRGPMLGAARHPSCVATGAWPGSSAARRRRSGEPWNGGDRRLPVEAAAARRADDGDAERRATRRPARLATGGLRRSGPTGRPPPVRPVRPPPAGRSARAMCSGRLRRRTRGSCTSPDTGPLFVVADHVLGTRRRRPRWPVSCHAARDEGPRCRSRRNGAPDGPHRPGSGPAGRTATALADPPAASPDGSLTAPSSRPVRLGFLDSRRGMPAESAGHGQSGGDDRRP